MMSKIAVIQHPPVLVNRDATVERAVALAREAASNGARLLVFPEAYVPGYPTYIWRLRPGTDMGLSGEIHARMSENAVNLASEHLEPLCAIARQHGVDILVGIDEIDSTQSRSTLYNPTLLSVASVLSSAGRTSCPWRAWLSTRRRSDDEHINKGKSSVIAPGGGVVAGPLEAEPGILYADVELEKVRSARRSLDVAGHYNRPDIFRFEVNRQRLTSARFTGD